MLVGRSRSERSTRDRVCGNGSISGRTPLRLLLATLVTASSKLQNHSGIILLTEKQGHRCYSALDFTRTWFIGLTWMCPAPDRSKHCSWLKKMVGDKQYQTLSNTTPHGLIAKKNCHQTFKLSFRTPDVLLALYCLLFLLALNKRCVVGPGKPFFSARASSLVMGFSAGRPQSTRVRIWVCQTLPWGSQITTHLE